MEEIKIEVTKESYKDEDNLCECMCGNWHHWKYTSSDADGNNACPNCTISFQSDLITKLIKLIKEIADPDLTEEQFTRMVKQKYADIMYCSVEDLEENGYFDDIDLF